MKRDLSLLATRQFDVVIVGGGIHGACVARDAAMRGMSVALVEQGDFCSATSHNSLKTIHGGIRYLQHLNFKRATESIREQQILRRTMGHLVEPLRFLMPNYGWKMRGPLAMGAGIALFEKLTFWMSLRDGNPIEAPRGRVVSAKRCIEMAPGVDTDGLTGGGIWADAQVGYADKAVLQILEDATGLGAVVANYVRADRVLTADGAVIGVACTGEAGPFEIKATQVVNATGPWATSWLEAAVPSEPKTHVGLVRSMNLVIDRPAPETAIAVKSNLASDSKVDDANRMFFMVPWQGKTVIGTTHYTHTGGIDVTPDAGEIAGFVADFNAAYPTLNVTADDVLYCYLGLTPGDDSTDADGAKLHESKVIDHTNARGLVSIISIKWTTARLVAERVTDVLATRFPQARKCRTRTEKLPDFVTMPHDVQARDDAGLRAFVETHVTHSQARTLADMVLRRTNDLVLGNMAPAQLRMIAQEMATALGWDDARQMAEVRAVLTRLAPSTYRQTLAAEFAGVSL